MVSNALYYVCSLFGLSDTAGSAAVPTVSSKNPKRNGYKVTYTRMSFIRRWCPLSFLPLHCLVLMSPWQCVYRLSKQELVATKQMLVPGSLGWRWVLLHLAFCYSGRVVRHVHLRAYYVNAGNGIRGHGTLNKNCFGRVVIYCNIY